MKRSYRGFGGDFPTFIAIIAMFFAGTSAGLKESALSALFLTGIILLGIMMTFIVSRLLSLTVLQGTPSSFTLELPPYRRPQIGRVILRSIFDRTLFVLGRAICIAAPTGIVIWLLANTIYGSSTLLAQCALLLEPLGQLLGMDGVILLAFILGLPANEIVVPLIIMAYTAEGSLLQLGSLADLRAILTQNGWTWITASNVMLFSLMHWPCSTTLLTIKEETQSWKWTALSFAAPTFCGMLICFFFTTLVRLFF